MNNYEDKTDDLLKEAFPPIHSGCNEHPKEEVRGITDKIRSPKDDLINELGSVWASHAKRLAEQPIINYRGTNGVPLKDTLHYAGGIIDLVDGENRLEPVPMKEISPTLVNFFNLLDSMRVRGSKPDLDIRTPAQSGTLQALVLEESNRVHNPHLRNLETFYANSCRLIKEQLLAGGIDKEVKKVSFNSIQKRKLVKTKITPVDLKKPHIIKVEFTARNAYMQAEAAQQADMLIRLGLPRVWVWESVLKIQDPKLMQDLMALEAYEFSPDGMQKRAIEVLMDRGYVFEATKLAEQMDRTDRMAAQEEQQAQTPQGESEGEPVPPEVGGI